MSKELLQKNIKDMKKIWGWQAIFASKTQISPVHPEILDDQIEFFIQSHISMLEEEIDFIKSIDVSGGGSGRRLKEQLLSHKEKELSEYKELIK